MPPPVPSKSLNIRKPTAAKRPSWTDCAAVVAALALLIIFQPELRSALARLGSSRLFSFSTTQQAIEEEIDTHPETEILEMNSNRIRVIDTDQGKQTQQRIAELQALVSAYRNGLIKENSTED